MNKNRKSRFKLNSVYDYLQKEKEIKDRIIKEEINIDNLIADLNKRNVKKQISFINCEITSIKSMLIEYNKPLKLKNCVIETADFHANYFMDGLLIERCEFKSAVDFQCGGHNKSDKFISMKNSKFNGFVNFFDCYFGGPVEIVNCEFAEGTNLLGNKNKPYEVYFEVKPILKKNVGNLNLDVR